MLKQFLCLNAQEFFISFPENKMNTFTFKGLDMISLFCKLLNPQCTQWMFCRFLLRQEWLEH